MATHCKEYDFLQIEPHWQSFWDQTRAFRSEPDCTKQKYYVLDMFPYPSGAGLHIGHPEGYTATDILARYKRAKGFSVLHPIGWDAFGLPAEQHAVKTGTHPASNTQNNITNFRRQIKSLGFSYDWDREIDTTDPRYVRWTQWIFLQLFKRGLAYVDERPVWWCPELRTVLANEEIVDGRSEVGGFPVERRNLRQWVLRITAYAERLLNDLKGVDWPDSTKRMQEAWIGRSEGAELLFPLENESLGDLKVFTTRPDTLYGATYMVIAPEHPLVEQLTTPEHRAAVDAYRRKAASKSDLERTDLAKEKSGVFTGSHAINPVNGNRIPIWIADYVLMGYGTGAIMAVPAHDERDYDFALQYHLPVVRVIEPGDTSISAEEREKLPFVGDGRLVNSGPYTGMDWNEAKKRMTADLAERNRGRATVNYKLRDWLFSRQRYWGEPFPILWVREEDYQRAAAAGLSELPQEPVTYRDAASGITWFALPLPGKMLPQTLPDVQSYLPSGTGESPLANVPDWLELWYDVSTGNSVPASGSRPEGASWIRARRETNTMPQWAGSCWYYLRFLDPNNSEAFASKEALRYWGVPDLYVGGAEHAVLHLLYSRFWHKVLFDIGAVPQEEPFKKLFHQGIILGEDGEKMSKSRGNVVNPDTIIASHGTDSLRLYLMFLGPLEAMKPWNPRGIEGVHRFLHKVWRLAIGQDGQPNAKISTSAPPAAALEKLRHETIRKVGEDIEALRFNTAISQMMIFANALQEAPTFSRESILTLVQLLAPFAPHLGEELWARLGETASLSTAAWPVYDPAKLVATEQKVVVQINGKHRGELHTPVGASQEAVMELLRGQPRFSTLIEGKTLKRTVFVPGRILNLVLE
ncbi:MAG: leucine--tRNA ligase [Opitutaceae bacterium]|nr:leucine--tRNA ligase [Opitutaceae bacterium]